MRIIKKAITLIIVSVLITTSLMFIVPSQQVQAAGGGVYNKLMSLQTKFPNGSFWNHVKPQSEAGYDCTNEYYADYVTNQPCASHNSALGAGCYDCNYFDGGMQCCGFAKKVFYDVFGERESSNSLIRQYTSDGLQVGDYVKFNFEHYAVVLSVSSDTFTVVECNLAGIGPSHNCEIRWNYTYNKNQIEYYVHANNYDSINNADSIAPVIKNVRITNITSCGYTVTCDVVDEGGSGIYAVKWPTWTYYNGQDDLEGWPTEVGTKTTYSFDVDYRLHNYEHGLYFTHIYAYDCAGNSKCYGVGVVVPPATSPTDDAIDYYNYAVYNDHLYVVYEENYDWATAEMYCVSRGGHLASINSQKENDIIYELIKNGSNYGYNFGGYDYAKEGEFVFTDGSSMTYTNWDAGQPDNSCSQSCENYCEIHKDGKWNDYFGISETDKNHLRGFILEIDLTVNSYQSVYEKTGIRLGEESTGHHILLINNQNGSSSLSKDYANEGEEVIINIEPNKGYELDSITVDGVLINENRFIMPNHDITVTVAYKKVTYSITVEYDSSMVEVTGIWNKESASEGDIYVFRITPKTGYRLTNVTANKVSITPKNGEYVLTQPAENLVVVITAEKTPSDKNGWVLSNGNYYYYKNNVMITSWVSSGGKWYYMDPKSGVMVTQWQMIGGSWYYFSSSGAMVNGWQHIDNTWYYFVDNGQMVTGWKMINSKWYYFKPNGAMVTGWQKVGNDWYYLDTSGAMTTGWIKTGNIWYYLDTSGAMTTGWIKTGNIWYYLDTSGAMVTGWKKIGNYWYYFDDSGAMKTGWLWDCNTWYYLDEEGYMVTGSRRINGKTYYFDESGMCKNP